MVQWLRLCITIAGHVGLILGQSGAKILQTMHPKKKKKEEEEEGGKKQKF